MTILVNGLIVAFRAEGAEIVYEGRDGLELYYWFEPTRIKTHLRLRLGDDVKLTHLGGGK